MKNQTTSILHRAKTAVRNFAANPASIIAGYWTTFEHPTHAPSATEKYLHCYPGIEDGQLVLIILPAEQDHADTIENADIKICHLRSLPKRLDAGLLLPETSDFESSSGEDSEGWDQVNYYVAQERIGRWINDEQRFRWFNRVGPYQCLVFPSKNLSSGSSYTAYLALSGTDAQLAGDLIVGNSSALNLYDTVQLIPPFGSNVNTHQDHFALYNLAMNPVKAAPHGLIVNSAKDTDCGPPALVATAASACTTLLDNQQGPLVCAFEQGNQLRCTISHDGGIKWGDEFFIASNNVVKKAPALAYTMEHIYCAFIQQYGDSEVLAWSKAHADTPGDWSTPETIGITEPNTNETQTINGVSICIIGVKLFCVYSTDAYQLKTIAIDLSAQTESWESLTAPTTVKAQHPALWFIDSTLFCVFTERSSTKLRFVNSTDEGNTWGSPTYLSSNGTQNSANGSPKLCVKDNTIFCLFESSGGEGQLRLIASHDRGQTWSKNIHVGGTQISRFSPANCANAVNVYSAWLNEDNEIEVCASLDGLSWANPIAITPGDNSST